jgi:hypothetical protein
MLRNRKCSLGAAGAAVAVATVIAAGASANAAVIQPLRPSGAHPAALPQIIITMNGKKITVSGALQSGGVRIISKVTQEAQGDPTLVRLDPGVTVGQVLKAAAGDPNNIALIASIVFSPQANRGISAAQANLKPGQYVAVDLASRAKTPPLTTFTIAKAAAPASLPRPQATMSAIEFGFRGSARLHDGELVRVANDGYLVHMMVAVRGRNAAGAQQIARLLKAGQNRQAQRLATGSYSFYNIMSHGAYQQQVIHNRPGYWVLACFMQTQDGRDHTQLGMERVIRIVR